MSRFDQVCVRLNNGKTLTSEPVYRALGDAQRPLGAADLRAKFLDCFAAGKTNADAAAVLNVLEKFEHADSCRALYRTALSTVTA